MAGGGIDFESIDEAGGPGAELDVVSVAGRRTGGDGRGYGEIEDLRRGDSGGSDGDCAVDGSRDKRGKGDAEGAVLARGDGCAASVGLLVVSAVDDFGNCDGGARVVGECGSLRGAGGSDRTREGERGRGEGERGDGGSGERDDLRSGGGGIGYGDCAFDGSGGCGFEGHCDGAGFSGGNGFSGAGVGFGIVSAGGGGRDLKSGGGCVGKCDGLRVFGGSSGLAGECQRSRSKAHSVGNGSSRRS